MTASFIWEGRFGSIKLVNLATVCWSNYPKPREWTVIYVKPSIFASVYTVCWLDFRTVLFFILLQSIQYPTLQLLPFQIMHPNVITYTMHCVVYSGEFTPGSPGSPVSSTESHDIAEILLKVELNTIILTFYGSRNRSHYTTTWLVIAIVIKTMNINTVELVQSDTWVFRHPVTSDKNLWSQSISVK